MGQAVSFSVSPFDVWSEVTSISWAFAGGAGASGPTATHTFPRPGAYPVGVTVTDAVGRAVAARRIGPRVPKGPRRS